MLSISVFIYSYLLLYSIINIELKQWNILWPMESRSVDHESRTRDPSNLDHTSQFLTSWRPPFDNFDKSTTGDNSLFCWVHDAFDARNYLRIDQK